MTGYFSKSEHKTQDAGESIQIVENLVNSEVSQINPLKRPFEEGESKHAPRIKSERSMSNESDVSRTTSISSMANAKMDLESPNTVDEEASKAASILKGVAMDHRTLPPPITISYPTPFWSQNQEYSQHAPNGAPWLHNYASQETSLQ
jgi:hypothetical protein